MKDYFLLTIIHYSTSRKSYSDNIQQCHGLWFLWYLRSSWRWRLPLVVLWGKEPESVSTALNTQISEMLRSPGAPKSPKLLNLQRTGDHKEGTFSRTNAVSSRLQTLSLSTVQCGIELRYNKGNLKMCWVYLCFIARLTTLVSGIAWLGCFCSFLGCLCSVCVHMCLINEMWRIIHHIWHLHVQLSCFWCYRGKWEHPKTA